MTIRECIDRVDGLKPNQYSEEEKVRWLDVLDRNIYNDVILTHEGCRKEFDGYTTDDTDKELLAENPYDELYVAYLKMKIDEENQETSRYNVSAAMFNSYYDNYAKWYNKHHKPISRSKFRIWGYR